MKPGNRPARRRGKVPIPAAAGIPAPKDEARFRLLRKLAAWRVFLFEKYTEDKCHEETVYV